MCGESYLSSLIKCLVGFAVVGGVLWWMVSPSGLGGFGDGGGMIAGCLALLAIISLFQLWTEDGSDVVDWFLDNWKGLLACAVIVAIGAYVLLLMGAAPGIYDGQWFRAWK